MGCFSGRLMSAASDQKLFCELCSAFNCSFDEFVEEKMISPSYSSAILAPPPCTISIFKFGCLPYEAVSILCISCAKVLYQIYVLQNFFPRKEMFFGRTDVEAEIPVFWPPDLKS